MRNLEALFRGNHPIQQFLFKKAAQGEGLVEGGQLTFTRETLVIPEIGVDIPGLVPRPIVHADFGEPIYPVTSDAKGEEGGTQADQKHLPASPSNAYQSTRAGDSP